MLKVPERRTSVYLIPNTEHMAYRLVRSSVYKRGVGIRETGMFLGSVVKSGLGTSPYSRYFTNRREREIDKRAIPLEVDHPRTGPNNAFTGM
jgi:hypothetical protein